MDCTEAVLADGIGYFYVYGAFDVVSWPDFFAGFHAFRQSDIDGWHEGEAYNFALRSKVVDKWGYEEMQAWVDGN